jgi:putative transposase
MKNIKYYTEIKVNKKTNKKTGGNLITGWKKTRRHLFEKKRIEECKLYSEKQKQFLTNHKLFNSHGKNEAIHAYHSAITSTKESLKALKKNPNNFTMKKKENDYKKQTIYIENSDKGSIKWNDTSFILWPNSGIGEIKVKDKRELKKLTKLSDDNYSKFQSLFTYESPNNYYVCISYYKKKTTREINSKDLKVIAFDPGVRCLQTGFDGSNYVEYGKDSIERIYLLTKKQDKIKSEITKYQFGFYESIEQKKRYKNKRHLLRKNYKILENKIKHLQDDMIHRLSNDVCNNYDHVMISKFNISNMIKNEKHVINKTTKRKMLRCNHFRLRQFMKQKAETVGCNVHEVSEHYMSKACGSCGCLNRNLGGSKICKCKHCGFTIPRDFNGARNIYIMNIENCVGDVIEMKNPFSEFDSELGPSYLGSRLSEVIFIYLLTKSKFLKLFLKKIGFSIAVKTLPIAIFRF